MRPCNEATHIIIEENNSFNLIFAEIVLEFRLQLHVFFKTGFNCELLKLMFELRCPKPDQFEGFFYGYMKFDVCYPMSVFKILLPSTGVQTFPV